MAKRGADKYITDQNWDEEDEAEEAGVFRQADPTTMERRQVKKAKRRGVTGETTESTGTGGVFAGFTGFSKATGSSAASAFSSLGAKPFSFSNGSSKSETEKKDQSDAPKPVFGAFSKMETKSETESGKTDPSPQESPAKPLTNGNGESGGSPGSIKSKYLHQLKSLNEGVTKWIKEHVDKNPYCILTPIFKDYEKYLADLEEKFPASERNKAEEKSEANVEETKTETSKEKSPESKSEPEKDVTPSQAGGSTTTTTTTSTPLFQFGSGSLGGSSSTGALGTNSSTSGIFGGTTSSSGSTFSGFSFSSGTGTSTGSLFGSTGTSGFSFAAGKLGDGQSNTTAATGGEEEEYVPPKEEVKAVEEEGAFYTKRCKLFFKKGDQWKEKGVGNLHLKPCEGKTQLLVRADTNLGNILLNIMLSSSLPVSRQGKNNVTLVCVPNPPLDEKKPDDKTMVPMLIRVKTGEEADELLDKLKEHKS